MRILAFLLGAAGAVWIVVAAVRAMVVPRPVRALLPRFAFHTVRGLVGAVARRRRAFEAEDRILATAAPLGLVAVVFTLMAGLLAAFTPVFWSLHPAVGWGGAFRRSGSSLTTLGFSPPEGVAGHAAAFLEAGLGLLLLTLLISYLPAIYTAFSRRETKVALLAVRAGTPPRAVEFLVRYRRLGRLDRLEAEWEEWEVWFADLGESHTTYPSLVFYRSPDARRSWITAAGTVLDAAALWVAVLADVPRASARLCIRSGYLALRQVADAFGIPYDPAPSPRAPVSITRAEFDGACDELAAAGVPLREDRDAAWSTFAGWRANYDTVLLALAELIHPPYAPWTGDRSAPDHRPHRPRRRWVGPAS